jgi:hypothetical protein
MRLIYRFIQVRELLATFENNVRKLQVYCIAGKFGCLTDTTKIKIHSMQCVAHALTWPLTLMGVVFGWLHEWCMDSCSCRCINLWNLACLCTRLQLHYHGNSACASVTHIVVVQVCQVGCGLYCAYRHFLVFAYPLASGPKHIQTLQIQEVHPVAHSSALLFFIYFSYLLYLGHLSLLGL